MEEVGEEEVVEVDAKSLEKIRSLLEELAENNIELADILISKINKELREAGIQFVSRRKPRPSVFIRKVPYVYDNPTIGMIEHRIRFGEISKKMRGIPREKGIELRESLLRGKTSTLRKIKEKKWETVMMKPSIELQAKTQAKTIYKEKEK